MSPTPPWNKNQSPAVAYIREEECIGCTKCIPDCPTDAIMGAAKLMHTVIADVCTGCQLCVPTCPVDCIEMRPLPPRTTTEQEELNQLWLNRFTEHTQRHIHNKKELEEIYNKTILNDEPDVEQARKNYIEKILARKKK